MATEKRSLVFGFLGDDMGLGKSLKGLAKDSDHAHSSLSRLGKVAIGAGAVAGVALLTKKVIDFGKGTVDSYTHAAKSAGALQRIIGGTVEDASRLGFAAHEAGVSEESFTKSLRLLEKNLGSATKAQIVKTKHTHQEIVTVNRLKDGHIVHVKALKNVTDWTSKTVKVGKDLGFTYKDAHGKLLPMRDIMLNVADKFQKMPNGVEKTALALKLFGRAGTDMIPVLNKGRDGVRELMAESDKLGTTMSGKDVKNVKEYTLQQRHLHAAMDGLKITLGRELFPIFTAWSQSLADNAPKIIGWVKDHLPGFRREAKKVADFITHDLAPAVSDFTTGLVREGGKLDKEVRPFFNFVGDHPDLFKQLGKDALILGGVLKARSFLTGMGLLKGLTGGSAIGGAGGALGKVGSPIPVFVTNAGALPGPGGVPGGAKIPPVVVPPGAKVPPMKVPGAGALLPFAIPMPDVATADQLPRPAGLTNKQFNVMQDLGANHSASKVSDADLAAIKAFVVKTKPKDKEAADWRTKVFNKIVAEDASRGVPADRFLDDPKRGRAARNDVTDFRRGAVQGGYATPVTKGDLVHLLTPGSRPSVTNRYDIKVYGVTDLNKILAEAHRQARISAVGSTNTPASRDRG